MSARVAQGLRAQNPFYLASAGAMLLGCYLLTGASSRDGGGSLGRVLPLLGWLNLYEVLLIALAVALTRRGALRDGRTLLVLESVFLADATHLVAEAITASGSAWVGVALALGVVAVLKVAAIAKLLRLRFRARDIALLALPAALCLVLPGGLEAFRRTGAAVDLPLYGAWWSVGLVSTLALLGGWIAPAAIAPESAAAGRTFAKALLIALPSGLIAHVWATHWLYDAPLFACDLTPLLLALGVAVVRAPGAREAVRARVLVPAIAVAFSLPWPEPFRIELGFTVSPLRAALVVTALVYAYDYTRHRQRFMLGLASGAMVMVASGPTLGAMLDRWSDLVTALGRRGRSVMPRSLRAWGLLFVTSAYALLGLGAWSSLRARRGSAAGQQ